MELERIARILYNMALDMDYADYIEGSEEEIKQITTELNLLKSNNCDSLLGVLQNIALDNENMEFWKESIQTEE